MHFLELSWRGYWTPHPSPIKPLHVFLLPLYATYSKLFSLYFQFLGEPCRQQQKRKFSLPWEILTERCNSPSQNIPFFQNADSWFFVNTILHSILTLFTRCKHRHQYYIGIVQIFEPLRLFQRVWNFQMLRASLEFRIISLVANH